MLDKATTSEGLAGTSYIKELTDMCNVFNITLGNIPNKKVGISKDNNKKNSLLLMSLTIGREG